MNLSEIITRGGSVVLRVHPNLTKIWREGEADLAKTQREHPFLVNIWRQIKYQKTYYQKKHKHIIHIKYIEHPDLVKHWGGEAMSEGGHPDLVKHGGAISEGGHPDLVKHGGGYV